MQSLPTLDYQINVDMAQKLQIHGQKNFFLKEIKADPHLSDSVEYFEVVLHIILKDPVF